MEHQFKTVAIGGFKREDVLSYFELSAKAHSQELESLQGQLTEESAARTALQEALDGAQSDLAQQVTQTEELQQALNLQQSAVARLEERCAQDAKELAQLRQLVTEQKLQLERLTPDAAAYVTLKDHTAGIELKAHSRAQKITAKATRQAEQLEESVIQWVTQLQEQNGLLCAQLDSRVIAAKEQIAQAEEVLEEVQALVASQMEALVQHTQSYLTDLPETTVGQEELN